MSDRVTRLAEIERRLAANFTPRAEDTRWLLAELAAARRKTDEKVRGIARLHDKIEEHDNHARTMERKAAAARRETDTLRERAIRAEAELYLYRAWADSPAYEGRLVSSVRSYLSRRNLGTHTIGPEVGKVLDAEDGRAALAAISAGEGAVPTPRWPDISKPDTRGGR